MSGPRRVRLPSPVHWSASRHTLPADATHHLCHVLRLRPGDRIEIFDGEGWSAQATIIDVGPPHATVEVCSEPSLRAAAGEVHLGLAILKGNAMDDAIRMATEAGVTHLHPMLTQRVVARGDRRERWERIVQAAATQCLRADVPQVEPAAAWLDVLARCAQAAPHHSYIALPGAGPAPVPAWTGSAALLIGPEGGWTDEEIRQASSMRFQPLWLGPWVLRASTAAVVGISALVRRHHHGP